MSDTDGEVGGTDNSRLLHVERVGLLELEQVGRFGGHEPVGQLLLQRRQVLLFLGAKVGGLGQPHELVGDETSPQQQRRRPAAVGDPEAEGLEGVPRSGRSRPGSTR